MTKNHCACTTVCCSQSDSLRAKGPSRHPFRENIEISAPHPLPPPLRLLPPISSSFTWHGSSLPETSCLIKKKINTWTLKAKVSIILKSKFIFKSWKNWCIPADVLINTWWSQKTRLAPEVNPKSPWGHFSRTGQGGHIYRVLSWISKDSSVSQFVLSSLLNHMSTFKIQKTSLSPSLPPPPPSPPSTTKGMFFTRKLFNYGNVLRHLPRERALINSLPASEDLKSHTQNQRS